MVALIIYVLIPVRYPIVIQPKDGCLLHNLDRHCEVECCPLYLSSLILHGSWFRLILFLLEVLLIRPRSDSIESKELRVLRSIESLAPKQNTIFSRRGQTIYRRILIPLPSEKRDKAHKTKLLYAENHSPIFMTLKLFCFVVSTQQPR